MKEALDTCGKILAQYADDIDALCDRAEAYIANEQYEKGRTIPIGQYLDIS